jgi:hypothetical protein
MATDHNSIHTIVEKLAILEGRITPASVTSGLNAQQKSVPQLPALFRPKTQKILGGDSNAKNPMGGYMVGSGESADPSNEMVEDVLDTVKRSFTDYLKTLEDELKSDPDLKDKIVTDSDIKLKDTTDRALKSKEPAVNEEPATEEPTDGSALKTVTLSNGIMCEIHGNEQDGFEIRRGAQILPTRFQDMSQAEMALEMFQKRVKNTNQSQDYIDEA